MSYSVYCHMNKVNGKRYIGITSQKPKNRWQSGKGYKNNPHFYRAIQEYGWDGFTHNILFDGLTLEEAEHKEIELIKRFRCCNPKYGYNIERGGNGGYKYTEEVKKKIADALKGKPKSESHRQHLSEARKGMKLSDETRRDISKRMSGENNPMYGKKRDINLYKTKAVLCIEINKVFISTTEASRQTGVQQSDISRVCNGKLKTAGKYHWKFVKEE